MAGVDHGHLVAQGQNFVQVVRDQQHGGTGVTRCDELVLHVGHGGLDATAFGRLPEAGKEPKDWPALTADGIPPDQVAVLFLSHDPASIFQETGLPLTCPVPTATGASGVEGNGEAEGFRLVTDAPVSASKC